MAYPTPIVQIAFDDGPYVASPTWTDVTSYVRSMSINRGRSDDWGEFAGNATVVLNNRTRLFDPYYTSGTYYGKLLPRRQIRIRATAGATTYDVFRGYIDGWNPQWTDAGTDSTTTIQCFDALQLLAGEQLPADWSRPYILSTSPRHYYPCDEPIQSYVAGQTITDYGSLPQNMTTTTAVTQGPELAAGLPSRSVQGNDGTGASSSGPLASGTINFSFACWAVFDGGSAGSVGFQVGNAGGYITYNTSTSQYQVVLSDGYSGLIRTYTVTQTYDSGTPRFLAFSWNATSKALQFWVNGVLAATTVTTAGAIIIILFEQIAISSAQAQCIVAWDGILSTATVQNIYNYSTAYFPETTAARFQRIIAETTFPSGLTSPASSPSNSVLEITNDAPQVSNELQITARSEGGPLFVNKSGVVTMFNQNQIRTQSSSIVSQVTYGVGGSKMGTEATLVNDGDSMRNQVFTSMSGGGVYSQENTSSISTYGSASMTVNTYVQTLANAQALANINTKWGSQIYPLLSPVRVVISPDDSWNSTLALELNDRVTVKLQPPTGNVINHPMLVSRIQHDVVPGLWTTTLEGSARWAAVFILGTSTLGGTDLLG